MHLHGNRNGFLFVLGVYPEEKSGVGLEFILSGVEGLQVLAPPALGCGLSSAIPHVGAQLPI